MKLKTTAIFLFLALKAFSQTPTWQLWASGLPQGVFPKLSVAPNHDIFYGLVGTASTKGIVYKANTATASGIFVAMPTIAVPSSITNNIQMIECNVNSEPIVGIFRSDVNQPFLYKFSNVTNTWAAVSVASPPTLGAFCMARAPNGDLWLGAKWANIYKSTNNGTSFQRIDETAILQNVYPCYYPTWSGNPADGATYSVNVDKNGRVYVGTEGAGVIYSDDAGISWHPADLFACQTNNPTQKNANSVMRPISDTGNVGAIGFTADNKMLWNGVNMFALNWTQRLGLADMVAKTVSQVSGFTPYFLGSGLQVTKIVTTATGHIFLHSGSNASVPTGTIGIYTSTDGINWTLFNTGITGLNDGQSQGSLAVDGNKVFMATHDGKIWMYEVCTPTLTLTHPQHDMNNGSLTSFKASQNINSTAYLGANAYVTYSAGTYLLFNPGFQSMQGSIFDTKLLGCN